MPKALLSILALVSCNLYAYDRASIIKSSITVHAICKDFQELTKFNKKTDNSNEADFSLGMTGLCLDVVDEFNTLLDIRDIENAVKCEQDQRNIAAIVSRSKNEMVSRLNFANASIGKLLNFTQSPNGVSKGEKLQTEISNFVNKYIF